ncbi:MAG: hypothetical protein ACOYXT_27885 [Bacteroidota bacterium]
MKTTLFLAIMTVIVVTSGNLYGQHEEKKVVVDGVNINELKDVEYVQLLGLFDHGKLVIEVDYGQPLTESQIIAAADGHAQTFESMIGALNFMHKNGWEFLNAFEIKGQGQGNVYHFILKRIDQ